MNGTKLAGSANSADTWTAPQQVDLTSRLRSGENVLLAEVQNYAPGSAGLLAWLRLEFSDGSDAIVMSDRQWMSTDSPGEAWWSLTAKDLKWPEVRVVANFGNPPWRYLSDRALVLPPPAISDGSLQSTKPVTQAMLYMTALGIADASMNGKPVADEYFTPGWTDYTRRVYYRGV